MSKIVPNRIDYVHAPQISPSSSCRIVILSYISKLFFKIKLKKLMEFYDNEIKLYIGILIHLKQASTRFSRNVCSYQSSFSLFPFLLINGRLMCFQTKPPNENFMVLFSIYCHDSFSSF